MTDVRTPDGAVLRTLMTGTGRPLLLVSGLGGTAAFWDALTPALAASRTVIRFDQRGLGGSTRGTAPVTAAQLATDCCTVLDAHGTGRAAMLGHSLGGAIVQTLLHAFPDRVDRAALSGTWMAQDPHLAALFRNRLAVLSAAPDAYARLSALLSYPANWINAHPALLTPARPDPPITAERIAALLAFDGRAAAGAGPVELVLGAADDQVIPAHHQQAVAAAWPGATLRLLPDGGHFFPITRAGAVAPLLLEWLDRT